MYIDSGLVKKYESFSDLRKKVEEEKILKIKNRLDKNPSPTTTESILGAFLEMYQPQVFPFIPELIEKGYLVEPSSGFCGKYQECQALNGLFPIDDTIINRLLKIKVKVFKSTRSKSIKFWPESADLKKISDKYEEIVEVLPNRNISVDPAETEEAVSFRRKYIPKNSTLKRNRLFEIMKFKVVESVNKQVKSRKLKKPQATDTELSLGVYLERIEPQVRPAVLMINRKGHSTDVSGFMEAIDSQSLAGDFILEDEYIERIRKLDVSIETNPSGYTVLQFKPEEADIEAIRKKWISIASIFPVTGRKADPSMTRKAREFRQRF